MSESEMVTYRGECHCRALGVRYRTRRRELTARACQCSFCRRHGACYSSDPEGRVRFLARRPEQLQRYRFGARTIEFLLCRECGCLMGAVQGGDRACVNAGSWLHAGEVVALSFEDEEVEQRRERRARGWSPAQVLECEVGPGEQAARMLQAYFAELAEAFGGYDPGSGPSASFEEMAHPQGVFLTLSENGVALACGGLKTHAPGVGEIKRMYVAPQARGCNLGEDLLEELERRARELGMTGVVLDTAAPLTKAAALYRRAGYREVEPFNSNPYANAWFRKELTV